MTKFVYFSKNASGYNVHTKKMHSFSRLKIVFIWVVIQPLRHFRHFECEQSPSFKWRFQAMFLCFEETSRLWRKDSRIETENVTSSFISHYTPISCILRAVFWTFVQFTCSESIILKTNLTETAVQTLYFGAVLLVKSCNIYWSLYAPTWCTDV